MFTLVSESLDYLDEALTIPIGARTLHVQQHLRGVLREASMALMRGFERGDPEVGLGGSLVIPGSPARARFLTHRRMGGETYGLRRQLQAMGVAVTLLPADAGAALPRSEGGMTRAEKRAAAHLSFNENVNLYDLINAFIKHTDQHHFFTTCIEAFASGGSHHIRQAHIRE